MYLIDSGKPKMAASANKTGTTPPILNRIGQPCCGTNAARGEAGNRAAERNQADGDDRQRRAQVARRGFGIDGHDVRDDAADARARR